MPARLAVVWPFPVAVDADLRRSLGVLAPNHDPEQVVRAGYALSATTACILGLATVALFGVAAGSALGAASGLGLAWTVQMGPRTLASLRRTRALGDAVELVSALALRMRLSPVPERAALFAARSGEGVLARSLADWVDRRAGTPRSGLDGFAAEWSTWFPALERAVAGVEAAADTPPERRGRVLDRAVAVVERALNDRVATFASDLHGPVTGLYAFGVLLPLALVATLPAAATAGVPVTPVAFVLAYDVVLPGCVAVAGLRLVASRPVAFPPPDVTVADGDHVDAGVLGVMAGVGVAGAGWLAGAAAAGNWAAPIAALGGGLGACLVVVAHPVVRRRRRVRELERGLSDAISAVGRAVVDGEAVETAMGRAGESTPGPAGEAFLRAADRRRLLGLTVDGAFVGEHGPFANAGGARSRTTARLLSAAARDGRPAGAALLGYADRLDGLIEHEREGRRALASVTRTLAHTGALYGPLVGGATVALAARLASANSRMGSGLGSATGNGAELLPTALVGTAIGTYALLLAVTLTALATGLERGLDGWLVAYRVGIALLSAVGAFLVGVVGAGLLL